jgi:hypothetical protein
LWLIQQLISSRLPGVETPIQLQNVGIAQSDQRFGRLRAHIPAAAVKDDAGIFPRQLAQVVCDLIVGDKFV